MGIPFAETRDRIIKMTSKTCVVKRKQIIPAESGLTVKSGISRGFSDIDIFFHLFLLYAMFVLFVLPTDTNIRHAVVALPIFGGFLAVILLRRKLLVIDILLVLILLIAAFVVGRYETISNAFTLSILLLFFSAVRIDKQHKVRTNQRVLQLFCGVAFLSLTYQLIKNMGAPGYWEYTSTLYVGDTNFSGFYMLLFFFLSQRSNFWPGMALGLASVLIFLSRAYFLSMATFLLLSVLKDRLKLFWKHLNFGILVLTLNIVLLAYGAYIVNQVGISDYGVRGVERLVSFSDRSALVRLEYNYLLFQSMLKDPVFALFGKGQEFDIFSAQFLGKVPHNTFMQMIGEHGLLFTLSYLLVLSAVFRKLNWRENAPYLIAVIMYGLFLHGTLEKAFLILIILTLEIQTRKQIRISR